MGISSGSVWSEYEYVNTSICLLIFAEKNALNAHNQAQTTKPESL